jgi:hypothetical protein
MTDIVANLKDRFSASQFELLEWWDVLGFPSDDDPDDQWTAAEDRALQMLIACLQSVDAVPSEQLAAIKALFERSPTEFERAASSLTKAIGVTFFPENATSFCETLHEALN